VQIIAKDVERLFVTLAAEPGVDSLAWKKINLEFVMSATLFLQIIILVSCIPMKSNRKKLD